MPMQEILLKENEAMEPLADGALYILQNGALPRFSLDACLLAAFCSVKAGERAADFCSGTGIIPLLLTLREPKLEISAIELLPELADMASRSFALNKLENLTMHQGDIKNAAALIGGDFDFVTCNPPYFPLGKSRISDDIFKAAARSELHCTLSDCISAAAVVLKQGGRLAICIIHSRTAEAEQLLQASGLQLRRKLKVRDNASAEFWLTLLEAQKSDAAAEVEEEELTIYDANRCYTSQMQQLCSAWLCAEK